MFKRYCVGGLVTVLLALLVVGTVVTPVSAAPDGSPVHVVRRGETLYSIARRYGVDMWAVARANGITNPNRIYAGQRLVIPTGQRGDRRHTGAVHVVQRGETLYRIALNYGVSRWAVARANHIANPNHIYVGQRLIIP
ncbi:MAG: LysM peptidoglycan-binding domain-containing protein [Anaerolineae bacterium]|jgi:putative chitinase